MRKIYLRDPGIATGSIEIKANGEARLIIRDSHGKKLHDKIHKSERAARAAWYRRCN